jgi:hypothetical protein
LPLSILKIPYYVGKGEASKLPTFLLEINQVKFYSVSCREFSFINEEIGENRNILEVKILQK